MIVKDEASNIVPLLHSVKHHIDGAVLCDTGSTDNTLDMFQAFCKEHDLINCRVMHHTWEDFSFNRNLCFRDGKRSMSKQCRYWFVLDADQRFFSTANQSLLDIPLTADAYKVRETSQGYEYSHFRLVRTSKDFYYSGAIHELLDVRGSATSGSLPDSFYTTHDTRHKRGIEQDITLMEKDLARNPSNSRMIFHLGLAYFNVNITASIHLFARRMHLGDSQDSEESFWSRYSIARALEMTFFQKDEYWRNNTVEFRNLNLIQGEDVTFSDVQKAFERASSNRPYRYEPYARLANLFWESKHDGEQCYRYAFKGITAGPVTRNTLFADASVIPTLHHLLCTCGTAADRAHDPQVIESCARASHSYS